MEKEKIKIIFENEDFLVLDKPAGWVTTKENNKSEKNIEKWLEINRKNDLPRNGIVHRLDKGTSGTEAACERKNPNCGAKVGGNATPFICDMRPPLFSDKKKLTYRLLSHHMKYCCELFLMFFEIDSSG